MKNSSSTENDLIERARRRDESAFAGLVEAYTSRLYRVVRRMTTDTQEAESIVQETFWRFWNILPKYDADRPLFPYLATISSNLARDRYRRERRIVDEDAETVLERTGRQDTNLEEKVDQKEALQVLAEAVDSLPFDYRAVISLRYDANMRYEEIASTLSLPLNTVRTHLRRAKQILREQVEEADHG
jgi:RNA polymerase sigma-70 factor (ECF subfamily)